MSGPGDYRPGVGIMLVDARARVWVGRRADTPGEAWQMPQGGIDAGETPREACMRELAEEAGTDRATVLAESRSWLHYDLPLELAAKLWQGRYRGQRQKWFLLAYEGEDSDFELSGAPDGPAEFCDWRWLELDALCEAIVPFKRDLYARVVEEFRPLIDRRRT